MEWVIFLVDQRCENDKIHNIDIIFLDRKCLIIQSCQPDGANSTRTGELRWDACQHSSFGYDGMQHNPETLKAQRHRTVDTGLLEKMS